ncbi:hypothetical protein OTK49_03110 [Vibrio coralliirubri]|uniref:hypothetical protein n=1 Tax=Vibrio coralliirubri TaxID=1516159 RepID=UPI002284206E|nr:hypothetical protein [Vibrio coralliirubri]MCY9861505.1 hypothetical protein [Vibrio coralliirubri]
MTKKIETPIAAAKLTSELLDAISPNCYKEVVEQYAASQGVDLNSRNEMDEIYEILGAVQPVSLAEFLVIRAKLNEAFMVGELPAFAGAMAIGKLELGTLRCRFFLVFEDVVGKPFVGNDEVPYEQRLKWRNKLISEFDQLVR